MSTRSSIAVVMPDGSIQSVYCHFDGYVEGVGATLNEYYKKAEKAQKLVKNGNISSLDENCDGAEGHSWEKPIGGQTVYYGRDRGEKGQKPDKHQKVEDWLASQDNIFIEHYYFHDGEQWLHSENASDQLSPLADKLAGDNEDMVVRITIDTSNDAFKEAGTLIEVKRILNTVVLVDGFKLHDINGNQVGEVELLEGGGVTA